MNAGDEMVRGLGEVLAGHAEYPRIGGVACHGCNWQSWEAGGTYDEHVAEALAAHVLGLVAAGKVEALREAAKELPGFDGIRTHGDAARWLRDRADGLAGEAS